MRRCHSAHRHGALGAHVDPRRCVGKGSRPVGFRPRARASGPSRRTNRVAAVSEAGEQGGQLPERADETRKAAHHCCARPWRSHACGHELLCKRHATTKKVRSTRPRTVQHHARAQGPGWTEAHAEDAVACARTHSQALRAAASSSSCHAGKAPARAKQRRVAPARATVERYPRTHSPRTAAIPTSRSL